MRLAGLLTFSAELLPVDLAGARLGRCDDRVAERLRRVDGRRLDYLRARIGTLEPEADEVEARSVLAFTLAIGRHLIATEHGESEREGARAGAAPHPASAGCGNSPTLPSGNPPTGPCP